jgi:hypothetical protein
VVLGTNENPGIALGEVQLNALFFPHNSPLLDFVDDDANSIESEWP